MTMRTIAVSSLADLCQALSRPDPCNVQRQASINAIDIKGQVLAHGAGSNAVRVNRRGATPLTNVRAVAKSAQTLVVDDGEITDRTGFSS